MIHMDNNTNTIVSDIRSDSEGKEVLMNSTIQSEICSLVQSRINNGERVTLLALSKEKNISVNEIRNALVEMFGNRVTFKRGRTGGSAIA